MHSKDYRGFYQYMKHLVASNACKANSLLLSTAQKAVAYMAEHYNALLSSIIVYQCVNTCPTNPSSSSTLRKVGSNAVQHLIPLLGFSSILSSIAARLYNATSKEDLVYAISVDNARLIMESQDFKDAVCNN
ncbi:hypothetical protein ACIS_00559 [Anaplasma centrale str. Israel]|uniref:Uncharacterized protein n=2 Tax=Anaplasma centrale TaxID=769 RepID=D1AUD7_ANACI|nr:hypothetical protein ACIS_00559 [Anaplasma centrale str. Israel]